jgi:hypothetical protein
VDTNGSQTTVDLVCKGVTQSTIPIAPRTEGRVGVESVIKAFAGEEVPRFISPPEPLIDKKKACNYEAEY